MSVNPGDLLIQKYPATSSRTDYSNQLALYGLKCCNIKYDKYFDASTVVKKNFHCHPVNNQFSFFPKHFTISYSNFSYRTTQKTACV